MVSIANSRVRLVVNVFIFNLSGYHKFLIIGGACVFQHILFDFFLKQVSRFPHGASSLFRSSHH